MEGAPLRQEAVVLVGSRSDLSLADSQLVIEDQILVINLKPQDVTLLGDEIGELLLPPRVNSVLPDHCFAQSGGATKHLDVAICDPQNARGEATGTQVKHLELGLRHRQST